jgi:hypothetical protein
MKKILKISGIFLGGVIVGAVLMNLLHIYVRPTYRALIQTDLRAEEEFKAGRSRRENNRLDTTFHRWAVVNTESKTGFRVFRYKDNPLDEDSFSYPFDLLFLKFTYPPDKFPKGREIGEGIDRGKFAAALEAIGETEEATKQWQLAQQMTQLKDVAETKKLIHDILEQENTTTYMQAEKKVLEEPNQAQQQNRGDRE